MSVTPELDVIAFPTHYAYVLVQPGETKEVFSLSVEGSGGYVAFIERIACDWFAGDSPPTTSSVLQLIIDGYTREFRYEIQINKPYIYNPPIVARHTIQWLVTNNDVKSHYYGVLTDGCFARPKTH